MNIVLVNPQIPQNTGSISRTCAATGTKLCLVGKLGFDISDKSVKRAGLDYWDYVEVEKYDTWDDYVTQNKDSKIWLFSKYGETIFWDAKFSEGDSLVFGSETKGLGKELLSKYPKEQVLKLPMSCKYVRCLNLSNTASIALYEALRQIRNKNDNKLEL